MSAAAGFASADVAVTGSARMGILSTDSNSVFSSRVRMSFSGTGTTDSGLAFGGKFDAQDTQGANAGTSGSVFISGAFGKLTMGDVGGGDAKSVGQLASVGYTSLGWTNSINYVADGGIGDFGLTGEKAVAAVYDNQGELTNADEVRVARANISGPAGAKVLYTYTTGGLTMNASTTQLSNGGQSAYGIGASYVTGGLTLGVGVGSSDLTINNVNVIVQQDPTDTTDPLFAQAALDGFTGTAKDMSMSATYVMGSTTIMGIYQTKTLDVTRAGDAFLTDGTTAATENVFAEDAIVTLVDAVDVTATATSMGMSVVQKMDAMTLTAFTVQTAIDAPMLADAATSTRSGLGVAYDLGGGATIKAGWVHANSPSLTQQIVVPGDYESGSSGTVDTIVGGSITETATNMYDIGVTFSF